MTIEQMKTNKERELNNLERMEICYISKSQLEYLNAYNSTHGSSYRWDPDAMRAFFDDKGIEYEHIDDFVPCFMYVDRITYNPDRKTFAFPVVFGKSVCTIYSFPQYIAVPTDVDERMNKLVESSKLPF